MSYSDALEYLYTILRMDRAQEQMQGEGFLRLEDRRKIWDLISSIERHRPTPRIYSSPYDRY